MRSRLKPTLTWTLLILLGAAMFIPVPYVMTSPGPVFNTIGEVNKIELISISGTETYPTEGELDMTTVSEYGGPQEGLDMFQAIWGWIDPDRRVVPRESVYPEGETEEENTARNVEAFSTSQSYAIAAAMDYLDQPIKEQVIVTSVGLDTPAQDKLRAGDEILTVDGVQMTTPEQVVEAVRSKPIGTDLNFSVMRGDTKLDVVVTSGTRPDDPETEQNESTIPYIGIGIDINYSAEFEIKFGVTGVGGPSAGTLFAIGIIDKLTPGALTQGKIIAGTGTIDPDGNVGEIGGIRQKLIGARDAGAVLFLAPEGNCDEVIGHIPDGLTVAAIETLEDAMDEIEAFNAGATVTPCVK
ncbi:MAG: PDZ domain-containing protein [Actinobacteria bacterium]|nr:PDZ domain-containing protein [Actinomycetota bacterium]